MKITMTFLEINTPQGISLPAYLLEPPSPRAGVVVFHGFKSSKELMLGLGSRIARRGFTVLLPDQRGSGENRADLDSYLFLDLCAALDYLKDFSRRGIVGYSLNGYFALFTKADAVVSISPPEFKLIQSKAEEYGIPLHAEGLSYGMLFAQNIPRLILYGENDLEGFPEAAKTLAGNCPNSELIEIPGAYHNDICYRKEVLELVPQWLEEKLT